MKNLFLIAAKKKYRFQTSKGLLNIEQLFQLSQQALHELYLKLGASIQTSKGLLGKKGNSEVENKMEIVEAVFNAIVEDTKQKEALLSQKKLKQTILEVADAKEVKELVKGKSSKALKKMAAKL
ncbi:MAG: hypothetical protein AB8G86_12585 [Saprospiraceae bacterium]